ncbi:MAG: DotU family type IV/VI secretion system protein [Smithella sp.]
MHLSDYFVELVAYVNYFLRSEESLKLSGDQLKNNIQKLLLKSEDALRKGDISPDDYDQARFAVCAWIDEALLNSSWHHKEIWIRQQLQRIYYNTMDAGEIFFERLNSLGPHQLEVREIYYLCLSLGFTGRYFNDDHTLDQIKTANLKLLMGSSLGLPSLERVDLFPEAYPAGDENIDLSDGKRRSKWLIAVCAAAPLIMLIILFAAYSFILNNVGENYLQMVMK